MRRLLCLCAVLGVLALGATAQTPAKKSGKTTPKTSGVAKSTRLPLTTSSPAARKHFEAGMKALENLHLDEALADWRQATKADPDCALCHLFAGYATKDPDEETAELAKAKSLEDKTTPGEKLMIEWWTGVRANELVPAIAAMNDLVAMFPRDPRVDFLAARWLILRQQYEPGDRLLEKALAVQPNYPAALNEIGYGYAYTLQFPKAFAAMDRYVKLLPNEPNTQDSYGEISRLGGKFDAALLHYRAALKLDPKFYTSQLGLGDTYAMMGEGDKARAEYQKALALAPQDSDRLDVLTQIAVSYVRENKLEEADKAFATVVEEAHKAHLARQESQAYRMMAMYQTDPDRALAHLKEAEAVLQEKHVMSKIEHDEEHARIARWRAAPVMLKADGGETIVAEALADLEKMARMDTNTVVQDSYNAALGTMLVHDEKYNEAVPHLEDLTADPFATRVLLTALDKSGDTKAADAIRQRLLQWNEPTLEQALVVPEFRQEVEAQK
jgi:tetratricopeptide (TPR) repeat protein